VTLLRRLLPVLVAVLSVVAFLPALEGQFVNWDDQANFVANEDFRGLGWTQLKWMWTATLLGHYIPLTWMTLGLNYALGGMNPWGYHLGNLLLHAANALVFYFLARRLLRASLSSSQGEGAVALGAAFAAVVFSLHPLRVESVAWVTERRDVLYALFFLLSALAYLRSVDDGAASPRGWRWASVGAFVAALLSKSAAMTLPAAILLMDVYPLGRVGRLGWRRVIVEKIPYAVLAAAGAVGAVISVRMGAVVTPYSEYGVPARLAMTAYSFWFYPWKWLWPVGLSPLYELPPHVDPLAWRFLVPAVGLAVVTAGLVALARRWPGGLAAWVFSALMILPVSGAVHAGYQLAHDRYSYISGLGFAVLAGGALAWALGLVQARRVGRWVAPVTLAAAAAALVILAAGAWEGTKTWKDSETLWGTALGLDVGLLVNNAGFGAYGRFA